MGQRERFAARQYDLAIVDEAHRIKDHRTEGYQLVNRLKTRFLLLLTATPVESDLMELYNLVTLLKPGQLRTRQAFREEFVDRGDPTTPRNRDRLRTQLRDVMVRNTRALSDARLPPRVAATVVLEPSEAEADLYARVMKLVREEDLPAQLLTRAGSSPAALAALAERLSERHPRLKGVAEEARALGSTKKDQRLLELLTRAGSKTAVFTHSNDTLAHVVAQLESAGIEAAAFHAGLSPRERGEVVARFAERVPALVSTDVGAEGLNLQFASSIVNYDLPWNPMLVEQRIGRLHRIGQTCEVRVWNLCTRGTAEDRLLDVLDRRLNLFELVIGEMDIVLGYLGEEREFEQLVAEIYQTARDEHEVAAGFDRIAEALLQARGRYQRIKAFDQALLGEDYEL
jgi:SNF2 family DNA or RNA helicase